MGQHSSERAFTLIELLAVIAIIMVVLGLALPNFSAMMRQQAWVSAISALEGVVRRCRIFAINERRDYSVEICVNDDNTTQYFRIEVESALLETIPQLNLYFRDQCDYEPTRLPVDWRLTFQAGGGVITNYYSWHRSPDARFTYDGPKYDVDRQPWGVDQRIKDNLLVDDSNVLPHGIRIDFDACVNLANFDCPPPSLNHLPQYGWDGTVDLRFDARGMLVQTRNPEIVLRDRTGECVRLQILRSTGRTRKVW